MKKIEPFSLVVICIWIMGVVWTIPEIISLNRRGVRMICDVWLILIASFSVVLIISTIGIWLRKKWARTLYFLVSIGLFISFFGVILASSSQVYDFIVGILIYSPWLTTLIYGIYYLNRKDIRESFGLLKGPKSQNIEKYKVN